MSFFIIQLLFLVGTLSAQTSNLNSFETDYCTNYPEGPKDRPDQWKHCCLTHDMYFWAGGNKQNRNAADLELKSCIEATGAIHQAKIMYYAVRFGSYSPIKYSKKKWNNGWNGRGKFQTLTSEDVDVIEKELSTSYEYINTQLKQNFIQKLKSR
jgi:hypothetical protein